MGLIKLFIDRPIFLLMIELFLVVVGAIGYSRLGVELFPDVEPPVITITTEYPGAGPEEIESLVTKVIEEEVNQIGGIERLVSTSRQGLSQIVVEFELHIDAKEAQIDVRDKVSRVRAKLPDDIEEPLLQRLDFADRPILQLALRSKEGASKKVSEARLFKLADEMVTPLIQQTDGVGQVNLFGGREREVQINIDLAKLKTWKVTASELAEAIRKSNVNFPSGEFNEYPMSRSIRVLGEYPSVADIGSTVVKTLTGGRSILVSDLAEVKDTFKKRESYARLNDEPVVLMEVKKVSDGNTVAVSEQLTAELPQINKNLPPEVELVSVYDGAERIRMSLNDVIETLVVAGILAVLVVYFFLGSWQSTFITGISLPSVIITSFFALYVFGFTLNIMTLLGLTLAVGLLLDDAIVVRENIWNKIEEGMDGRTAAYEGTREVYIAVLATSFTILATFLPVLLIPGVVGRFFSAFAMTVCLCVFFSTVDALTVAPTLSALMLSTKKEKVPAWLKSLRRLGGKILYTYELLLRKSMEHPKKVLLGAAMIFLFSLVLPKWIGFTFLPEDDSGEIEVFFEAPPGTTIERTNEITAEMVQSIKGLPYIKMTSSRVGSDLGEENVARIYVELADEKDRDLTTSQMKTLINENLALLTARDKLTKTVGKPDGGGSQGKPVQLILEGADNEVLTTLAEKIIREAEIKVPGAVNMESNLKPGRDEWQLLVKRASLSAFALDTEKVGETLRALYQGEIAGPYREDGEEYDIRVQLPEGAKVDVDLLKHLTITNSRGEEIPLLAVVEPVMGKSPTKLVRIDQQRAARIQADLATDAPLGTVISELQAMIKPMLPDGYRIKFQGSAESLNDLKVGAMTAILLGGLFIYMIMASLYESLLIPFSILMTLPMAIIGALLALLLSGRFLDVYSIIGLILLMGLVGKNAIVLVDYAKQLMDAGKGEKEALLEAGVRRFRPIMMTVLSTVAGMLPIALGVGELNKFRAGMGIAAIGGLLSSTILSLLVVPCFFLVLTSIKRWFIQFYKKNLKWIHA